MAVICEVLVSEETPVRKALLDRVEVDEKDIRVIGSTEVLHATVASVAAFAGLF